MAVKEKAKRYIIFLIGLFINSLGVSFITKANLGTSPISSIPYTLSLGYPFTLGEFTFVFNLFLILLQILILRRDFKKESWLQIPVVVLFSVFIDLTMVWLSFLNPTNYILKVISLIIGCTILGFGVFVEIIADVVMLPGEAFVNAVSKTFNKDFGKTKIVFDSSMTIFAGAMGLVLYHEIAGVREGTVVAALLVGMIARIFKRKLGFIEDRFIVNHTEKINDNNLSTEKKSPNFVITISREYGSGGRKIGKRIAEELNMEFYDKYIIEKTAEEMKINEHEVEAEEQKLTNHLIYDMVAQFYESKEGKSTHDKLYETESKLIKKLALEGNCVIVGRCADYICKDMENAINIFLYADKEHKTQEVMKRENISYELAEKHVNEINKKRFNHYKYYTGRIFGLATNYDLCFDTGKITEDKIVEFIRDIVS